MIRALASRPGKDAGEERARPTPALLHDALHRWRVAKATVGGKRRSPSCIACSTWPLPSPARARRARPLSGQGEGSWKKEVRKERARAGREMHPPLPCAAGIWHDGSQHQMKELTVSLLSNAIARANQAGKLKSTAAAVAVEAPKDPSHGDIASNVALTLARAEGKPPRAIADIIKAHIDLPAEIEEVTVAGPGFINFRMAPEYWRAELRRAATRGRAFVRPQIGAGRTVQVEFLSANPTGPLTVGHGRNAVLGDTLARLHEVTGHQVTREYYFNNGGRQMKLLGESVRVRYLQELGRDATMPEDGYEGEYIREIARGLIEKHGAKLA